MNLCGTIPYDANYYDSNVYIEAVNKYKIKEILTPGMVLYGEVYGDGIQKNYNYGCKDGEHKLVIFDVMIKQHSDAEY